MRLGSDTNSFTNYMLSGTKGQPVPTVGMGATRLCWSDRHAYTIVEVADKLNKDGYPRRIGVTRDNAIRIDDNGMSEDQTYRYETIQGATIEYYTIRKSGAYIKEGESLKGGSQLRIGDRREYYDFSH